MTAVQPEPGWYPDPLGYNTARYWDGTQWMALDPMPMSLAERSDRLNIEVADAISRGWHVESRSATQVVMVRGRQTSGGVHVIHFLLTLLTCGLWAPIWILYGMSTYEDRGVMTVDAYGNVTEA